MTRIFGGDIGQPGFPAPDVPLRMGDTELSTADLFGHGWVLLTGEEGGVWHEAANHVAVRLDIPIETYGLGPDLTDPTGQLTLRYGIKHGGASLIRPDGVVAWRCEYEVSDAASTLHGAISALLRRAS